QFNKGFELESKYRESERDLAAAEIDLSDSRQQIESISTYINRLLEQNYSLPITIGKEYSREEIMKEFSRANSSWLLGFDFAPFVGSIEKKVKIEDIEVKITQRGKREISVRLAPNVISLGIEFFRLFYQLFRNPKVDLLDVVKSKEIYLNSKADLEEFLRNAEMDRVSLKSEIKLNAKDLELAEWILEQRRKEWDAASFERKMGAQDSGVESLDKEIEYWRQKEITAWKRLIYVLKEIGGLKYGLDKEEAKDIQGSPKETISLTPDLLTRAIDSHYSIKRAESLIKNKEEKLDIAKKAFTQILKEDPAYAVKWLDHKGITIQVGLAKRIDIISRAARIKEAESDLLKARYGLGVARMKINLELFGDLVAYTMLEKELKLYNRLYAEKTEEIYKKAKELAESLKYYNREDLTRAEKEQKDIVYRLFSLKRQLNTLSERLKIKLNLPENAEFDTNSLLDCVNGNTIISPKFIEEMKNKIKLNDPRLIAALAEIENKKLNWELEVKKRWSFDVGAVLTVDKDYFLGLFINWEVDIFGKKSLQEKIKKLEWEQAKALSEEELRNISHEIEQMKINLFGAAKAIEPSRIAYQKAGKELEDNINSFNLGLLSMEDLLKTMDDFRDSQAKYLDNVGMYKASEERLKQYLELYGIDVEKLAGDNIIGQTEKPVLNKDA
ncbi:MAG: hypothetical protein KKD79_07505, partial [Candidatus Omnitrophica bacterium]|nr:hypothetical protein [Candidatus Omnitrophota bacterium]